MSNIIIEAMATGLNCLSSDLGDNHVLLNKFGNIYEPQNKVQFNSLLKKFIKIE